MRYSRRYQAEILVSVGAVALLVVLMRLGAPSGVKHPTLHFLTALLLLLQPYTLLRLVDRFRPVPRWLKWSAVLCTTGGILILLLLPAPRPPALLVAASAYFLTLQGYAAWAFAREAARTEGVTRLRLRFAAVGALLVLALVAFEAGARAMGAKPAPPVQTTFSLGMILCYYLGLATPRRLRLSWQRSELYRFLKISNERTLIDRERHVAGDLTEAARRSMLVMTAAVLFGRDRLTVSATNDLGWANLTVEPNTGLLARAVSDVGPIAGRRAECEPALRDRAAGEYIAIAPLATASHRWGVLVTVQRRESLFLAEDLEMLRSLCEHATDILDHARLVNEERERQQRQADDRVKASESKLEIMVDSLSDYMIVPLDDEGRITHWNRSAVQLFGYAAGDIVGQPASLLLQDGATFGVDLAEARQGRSAVRESPCLKQDGQTFMGSSLIRRLRYDGHDYGGFVMVTRDVTEQRKLEDRVNQGQKMEAVGRLAAGVAHDFNNLLTVILGFANLNEQMLPENHGLRTDVVEIRKAAERAAALVRQLLAFSRRQVIEPKLVHLPVVVSELVPMLRRLTGDRIEIVERLDDAARPVMADPNQLEQIVVNLAVNARDAMPTGGQLTLRVTSGTIGKSWSGSYPEPKPGPYTVIEVSDNGTGMDAATLAHIFEPFFTTKKVGQGTGLGLATVYGLVQQMNGAISATSELGLGTTFKIYFPEVAGAVAAVKPVRRTAGPRGTETVLLAEDEAPIRRLVASVLQRAGYRVIVSGGLAEALEAAAAHTGTLDLLVTDMMMPGGTGPDLADRLRAKRPGLAVLYVSGNAALALKGRSDITLDALSFLQKPFTADQLLSHVRQVLDEAHQPQEQH